jgi:L-asparaginase
MIQIFLTGGTIDKHYIQSNGSMAFENSHIADILEQGRNKSDVIIDKLMFKDSLEMTDDDRETIAAHCESTERDKILITHGTDTMVATAKHIATSRPDVLTTKTIVLVGAMIPHEISYSDGTFNMGFAMGVVSTLAAGIYIAMNGRVFNWDDVAKNYDLGEFDQA